MVLEEEREREDERRPDQHADNQRDEVSDAHGSDGPDLDWLLDAVEAGALAKPIGPSE